MKKFTTYNHVVGGTLASYRLKHNLGQNELATKLDINQGSLSRIERGEINISINQLMRFAIYYNVKPNYFLRLADQLVTELNNRDLVVLDQKIPDKADKVLVDFDTLKSIATVLILDE